MVSGRPAAAPADDIAASGGTAADDVAAIVGKLVGLLPQASTVSI